MSVPISTQVPPEYAIRGLHHLTAITADAGRATDWYTGTLGLNLIARSVDLDDWRSHHLYFSTSTDGAPGTLLTLLNWPDIRPGETGIGGTHHVAFATENRETLLRWKRWLIDRGEAVNGPYDRTYFTSIYTSDPDGLIIEIATNGPGWTVDEAAGQLGTEVKPPPFETTAAGRDEAAIVAEAWPEPVNEIDDAMRLQRLHHVTAIGTNQVEMERLWTDVLGMRLVKRTINFDDPDSPHLYWGVGDGAPGSIVTFFVNEPGTRRPSRVGYGQTHHFAVAVTDSALDYWVERLSKYAIQTTPVQDRNYFRSVFFRDRDGHILELASVEPGFPNEVPLAERRIRLDLPDRLESQRERIEAGLPSVNRQSVPSAGEES